MLGNSIRNHLVPICVACTSFIILGIEIGPFLKKKLVGLPSGLQGFLRFHKPCCRHDIFAYETSIHACIRHSL